MKNFSFLLMLLATACSSSVQQEIFPEYLAQNIEEWRSAGSSIVLNQFESQYIFEGDAIDLQDFIDSISTVGEAIITLNAGTYKIDTPLVVPSGIFLKGENSQSVMIELDYNRSFEPSPFETPCTIEFIDAKKSGISDVTLIYSAAEFEPHSPVNFYDLCDKKAFKNDPQNDTTLYVGHIGVKNSNNILIDNCNVLNAGTDPIIIAGSSYVTVSNSTVKGSYNKGGKGNGYFNIDLGSHHVLVINNEISKIRHLAIQKNTHHNVVFDNYLEVDVNFHNGDSGYNLVERNVVRIPEWHGWHCFSAGAKSKHQPPGPSNYLYNNKTQYKLQIPKLRSKITEYGDSIIYETVDIVDTVMIKDQPMIRYEYGAIMPTKASNSLFMMNDSWEGKKRVVFKDSLSLSYLYKKSGQL